MRTRLPVIVTAAAYGLALLLVGLWPSHVDEGLDLVDLPPTSWVVDAFGLTRAEGYTLGEFGANILLFVPLGIFAMMLRPGVRWQRVALLGGLLSLAIEVAQTVARPGRTGSLSDVVANTAGAAAGAFLVAWWWRRRREDTLSAKA